MRTLQLGLSLIELMIVLALGTLFMLGITRYSIDSVQTDKVAFALSENQDSVRVAMDLLRQDVMMGGFKGCNTSAVAIESANDSEEWYKNKALLEAGVTADNNGIQTARLVPLFNPNPDIILEGEPLTIKLPDGHEFPESGPPLVLANCNSFQMIAPLETAEDVPSVSPKFFNRAEGTTMPSTRLYTYQETSYSYSDFIIDKDDNNEGIGGPSLLMNDKALITGLKAKGLVITPSASTTRFTVELSMQSPLQKDDEDGAAQSGVYQSNITALNRRMTQ